MREQLPPKPVPPWAEPLRVPRQQLDIAGEGAPFAATLQTGREDLRIVRDGCRSEEQAEALHRDAHRNLDVVESSIFGDRLKQRAPDGVHRAGAADAGIDGGFVAPDGLF